MKKIYYPLLVCAAFVLMSQFNPQTSKITELFFPDKQDLPAVTPALQKQKGFTNYKEMMVFLETLQQAFPQYLSYTYIGESKKGLQIPLVKVSNGSSGPKIKVWLQGGLHGDEPASTEAMLYLLYDLLHDSSRHQLLNDLDLALVPMANIDGYEKQQRLNAEGLDLNRDQTKLMAAETPALTKAFTDFKPQVALDFHEYRPYRRDFAKLSTFGVAGAYDVMFLYSGNLNVPVELRSYTKNTFVLPTRAMLDSHAFTNHDYFSSTTHQGEIRFNQGSSNARSSATNYALQNCISTLIEVRGVGLGRTSFKRRIYIGYLIALSYLDIAAKNAPEIRQALAEADVDTPPIAVQMKRKTIRDSLLFIDLESSSKIKLAATIRDAWHSTATLQRPRPVAYLLDASQSKLVDKIAAFGIQCQPIAAAKTFAVGQYTVTDYSSPGKKYEKMSLQEVKTRLDTVTKTFPAGTYLISMQQSGIHILPELLEPEAANSFVSFGVLTTELHNILPIYRLVND